jgi:hypothetical protein
LHLYLLPFVFGSQQQQHRAHTSSCCTSLAQHLQVTMSQQIATIGIGIGSSSTSTALTTNRRALR